MTNPDERIEELLRELERLRPEIETRPAPKRLPEQVLKDAIKLSRAADSLYPTLSAPKRKRLRVIPEFMHDNSLPSGTKLLGRAK